MQENQLCQTDQCGRPVRHNGDVVCSRCLASLLSDLRALRDSWDQLEDVAVRGTNCGGGGPRTHRASSRERPLPFDETAAALRDEVGHLLVAWAAAVQLEFPHRRRADTRPGASIAWLASLGQLLAEFPQAPGLCVAVANSARRVLAAVGRRARDRVMVGVCSCGTAVYSNPGGRLAYCPDCEAPYDVAGSLADRREFAQQVTGTAAELLENWQAWSNQPVSRATLFRVLAQLVPVEGERGAPRRYRVVDVAAARNPTLLVS